MLDDEVAGESVAICARYEEYELLELLKEYLHLFDFELLTNKNINIKYSVFIKDSDIITYGTID